MILVLLIYITFNIFFLLKDLRCNNEMYIIYRWNCINLFPEIVLYLCNDEVMNVCKFRYAMYYICKKITKYPWIFPFCTSIFYSKGRPHPPTGCIATNISSESSSPNLRVKCVAAYGGGLTQKFILELYDAQKPHGQLRRNVTSNEAPVWQVILKFQRNKFTSKYI